MIGLRLLPLLLGAGTVLLTGPAATAAPAPRLAPASDGPLSLLERASTAGRVRTYTGLQFVSAWGEGATAASVAEVRHSPAAGASVLVRPTSGHTGEAPAVAATSELDPRLLALLPVHYRLELAGTEACVGRPAQVVLARRIDTSVAGRFWLDRASGLVLRREVYDGGGALVRSSAFSALDVAPGEAAAAVTASPAAPTEAQVSRLRRGWPIPMSLPAGLDLYDARLRTHEGTDVLHVSYSDGLSTLSVFSQPGRLGTTPRADMHRLKLAHAVVWESGQTPQRVVWSGAGQVFTLLSDAPADAVSAAVAALPHDRPPRTGFLARIGRGIARVGSWLNPFD